MLRQLNLINMKKTIHHIRKHLVRKQFHIGHLFLVLLVQVFVIVLILGIYSRNVKSDETFTVNSTVDAPDANPGDGVCADSDGQCTIRAAIYESWALGGTETINIPADTYILTTDALDVSTTVNIVGEDARTTIIDGNNTFQGFVTSAGVVNISNVTIQNGYNVQGGGGILNTTNLTLTNVIIKNNSVGTFPAVFGAGIWSNMGSVVLENVLVQNNLASSTHPQGAGVSVTGSSSIAATNVTFSGNSAVNEEGTLSHGGALYVGSTGTNSLTNVTIDNNIVSGNSANGGGLYVDSGAEVSVKNSLFSNNTNDNCGVVGTLTSLGYNLSSDSSCNSFFNQTGDQNNTDPQLIALTDNGGETDTTALPTDSPAVDSASNEGCPETDQRDFIRPYNEICDIGAFEYGAQPAPTSTPTPTPTGIITSTPTLTYTPTPGPTATPASAPPSCNNIPPSTPPDLYQIDVTEDNATLRFAPAGKPYTYYYIVYGYASGEENFGVSFDNQDSDGSISYTINNLQPNIPYYFRVRAGNGCTPGSWSDWLGARTSVSGSYSFNKFNQQNIGIPFYTEPNTTPNVEEIVETEAEEENTEVSPTLTPTTIETIIPTKKPTVVTTLTPRNTTTPKPTIPPFEATKSEEKKQNNGFFSTIFSFFTNLFSF